MIRAILVYSERRSVQGRKSECTNRTWTFL